MQIDFQTYKKSVELEKLFILDDVNRNIHQVDAKNIKSFLSLLWLDQTESPYYRKRSLELTAKLTLLGKIQIESVVDKILDVENIEDHFIILQAIRLSLRFYKYSESAITEWLSLLLLHGDPEIRSEAYFSLGRIQLNFIASTSDATAFAGNIIKASEFFVKSGKEIENRIDATIFENICQLLLSAFSSSSDKANEMLGKVKKQFIQYLFFSIKNGELSSLSNLIDSLSILTSLSVIDPKEWLEFKNEFIDVLFELQKMESLAFCNELFPSATSELILQIRKHLINNILGGKLQDDISKLRRLIKVPSMCNSEQKGLINDIIQLIEEQKNNKKKDDSKEVSLVAGLHRAFPLIPLDEIGVDVQAASLDESATMVDIILKYLEMTNKLPNSSLSTGYSQGDEIMNIIGREVRAALPSFPTEKYLEFSLVLRDVANYFINAVRGGKSRFDFLFNSNALEKDLQDSLLTFFQAGERAGMYLSEVKEFADGGRIDIVYNSPNIQIPIELKRSTTPLDWEKVEQSYIAQAQTYSYSRDQLSFFIILDLSPQILTDPESNIRDLFKILNLKTRQNIPQNFPDYVIAFILPGNKKAPSQRSIY